MQLFYNDYQLHDTGQTLPSKVKRGLEGLDNPEQRLDVYDNPGRDGQTVANVLNGSSLISLRGSLRSIVAGTDQQRQLEYETSRLDLINAVRTTKDSDGRPAPALFKITTPSGSQYQAQVIKKAFKFDIEWLTFGTWTLHLINPRGIIEAQTATTTTVTLPQGGALKFPVRFPLHFSAASGGSATATNIGSADATPVITFYGPLDHPVLYHETLGLYLGLNLTLGSSDVVVAKPETPSLVQGTLTTTPTTPRMGSMTTGSNLIDLRVVPGQNRFLLRANSYDTGRVEIVYRDTWEGI